MQRPSRTSLYQAFTARFRPEASRTDVVAVTNQEIDIAEAAIGCKLPRSYRTFVTGFGAGDNDLPDNAPLMLAEIWHPERIVKQMNSPWMAPIPEFLTGGTPLSRDVAWKHLTPFGSEQSDGYWFCFRRELGVTDDLPVFYFSHDGGDIEQVADSFDNLIEQMLNLPTLT